MAAGLCCVGWGCEMSGMGDGNATEWALAGLTKRRSRTMLHVNALAPHRLCMDPSRYREALGSNWQGKASRRPHTRDVGVGKKWDVTPGHSGNPLQVLPASPHNSNVKTQSSGNSRNKNTRKRVQQVGGAPALREPQPWRTVSCATPSRRDGSDQTCLSCARPALAPTPSCACRG